MDMNIVLAARSLRDHLMESTSIYLSGLKKSFGDYMDINIVLAAYSWRDYLMESTYLFYQVYDNGKMEPLEIESWHDADFVIIGGTAGCQNDNLQCHQWWQS